MDKMTKIAIIADVVSSKKIKQRNQLQEILSKILEKVNHTFSDHIESNLTITLGDEFQGILNSVETALLIVDLISITVRLESKKRLDEEVTLRWGIGVGELNVPVQNQEVSLGSDGPAYWHAREAIDRVHKDNHYGKVNERVKTDSEQLNHELNSFINLQNIIRNQWTITQAETVFISLKKFYYETIEYRAFQNELSKYLNKEISKQTVSKRIISSHIKEYSQSRKIVSGILEDWRK